MRKNFLRGFTFALATFVCLALSLSAQTLTTGGISGTVTDASGAAIPGATVTATNVATAKVRTAVSSAVGVFAIPQVEPGTYALHASAKGFQAQATEIVVSVSSMSQANFKLPVGSMAQTVEVSGSAPIIATNNPNTTTTVGAQEIANRPNPGSDLTFEAQVAPGAVMNSTGGYGNVEFNGLPATSNNFTIDGMDANDPFLNLNNSGATNLQLGLNDMQEVSINTNSYAVDQGRMGASQINFVSKHGTNNYHGSLYEIWNGSSMNSSDYFINATGSQKPFSNVNEFGGDFGGPMVSNKLFFYLDLEGTRIDLPTKQTTYSPTPAFQQMVRNSLASGATAADPAGGSIVGMPGSIPFYNQMWGLYTRSGGTPFPEQFCNLNADGTPFLTNGVLYNPAEPVQNNQTKANYNPASNGSGCANQLTFPLTNKTGETYLVYRMDQNLGQNDAFWYKYQQDIGTQATYTDPLNSVFNAYSYQPERAGSAQWQHIFSPDVINVLNSGFTWYTAIFQPTNNAAANAAFPYYFASNFTTVGGIDYIWPQGRNVTQWQVLDNVSWIKGSHSFKFGENLRRDDISDHDFGFFNTPYVQSNNLVEYMYGAVGYYQQAFAATLNEPIAAYSVDSYAMDTWQMTPALTFTYGVRATWNENPVNHQSLFAYPNTSFYNLSHNVAQPMNQAIIDGRNRMLPSTPFLVWQPRAAIAWQLAPKTVLRGGFGLFSDIFPGDVADTVAQNPPYYNTFVEGTDFGLPYQFAPGFGNGVSARDSAVASQAAAVAGFASGQPSCADTAANPNTCFPAGVGLTALPDKEMKYPYSMQYSLGVERQFGNSWGLTVQWVGTGSRQTPYTIDPNGFQNVCAGCYAPWPNAPLDSRFSGVTQYESGANSNYNGLQTTLNKTMSHGLSFRANYTWSHCLDTISNGGTGTFGGRNNSINPIPGELFRYYGNCDYDISNSFNGSYTYRLPFHGHHGILGEAIDGWQISGDFFLHQGFPLTVVSAGDPRLINTTGLNFVNLTGANPYAEFQNLPTTQQGQVQWLNPAAFQSVYDPGAGTCTNGDSVANCQFGNEGRNRFRSPGFLWSDLFLTKSFTLTERTHLQVSAQAFNFLNHPNFAAPGATAGVQGEAGSLTGFGTISSLANTPTGLLGSGLGGDNAVRMIALQGKLVF